MSYVVGGLRLDRPFRIRRIGHFGHHCEDISATVEFMAQRLGLIPSDHYDATARFPQLSKADATGWFFRCNTDHHSFVVASQKLNDTMEPQRKGELVNQLSWQIGSLQEVANAIDYLDKKARLRRVGRDCPGSNWHSYTYDPDGYVNEVYYAMEQIGWEGNSKPIHFYERGFKTRPPLPQIPEFAEVDEAISSGIALDTGFHWAETGKPVYDVEGIMMPRPFRLTRLGRIMLFVSELERSIGFYRDVLGLSVSERLDVAGRECAFLRAENEHHTLALVPASLRDRLGISAAYGVAVATYQQLKDAYAYLKDAGAKILELPPELSPGVRYGFWVQGPDPVAVQIYYGMDCVAPDGSLLAKGRNPIGPQAWPATIEHGGARWFDPPFLGPLS